MLVDVTWLHIGCFDLKIFYCVTLQRTSCCHHSAWHRVYSNPAGCINENNYLVTLLDMVTNEFVTPIIVVLCFWLCLVSTSGVGTPTWCCFFVPNTTNPSTTIRRPSFIYSCTFDRPQLPSSRSCPHGWCFWNWNFCCHIFSVSWKSIQWVPCYCMRTDRRIDATKLIVAFCNFAKAPKSTNVLATTSRHDNEKKMVF